MHIMKLTDLPDEFIKATPIIEKIEQAGFEAYFVGGSVRDIILNQKIHDVDIATSAFPEEIQQIFPKTIDVGIEHGTVLVLFQDEQYEITTFRTESTYQDYRRPDEVTFVRSLEEDLKRRDFTMNALAMGKNGEIIDLFNGIEAINNKQIVAVGNPSERFHEDALRMMRGLRFSSQLNFEIEEKTKEAIKEHHALLGKISVERIYIEFIKLLTANYRNQGLIAMIETRCFEYCPGLQTKEKELKALTLINNQSIFETEELAWLILMYILNIDNPKNFLKKWKSSNKLMSHIEACLNELRHRENHEWDILRLYESGPEVISDVEKARLLLGLDSNEESSLQQYNELPIKSIRDLAITGKDVLQALDQKPGPWLGKLLKQIEESVVLGKIPNTKEILIQAALTFKEENE